MKKEASYDTLSKWDNTLPHVEHQEEAGGDQEPTDNTLWFDMNIHNFILQYIARYVMNIEEYNVK